VRCRDCNCLSPFPVPLFSRPKTRVSGLGMLLDWYSQHGGQLTTWLLCINALRCPTYFHRSNFRIGWKQSPSVPLPLYDLAKKKIEFPSSWHLHIYFTRFSFSVFFGDTENRVLFLVCVHVAWHLLLVLRGSSSLSSHLVLVLSNFCPRASLAFFIFT
jgi:hypothetical protein